LRSDLSQKSLWLADLPDSEGLNEHGPILLVNIRVLVQMEERELRERYGAEYEAYCARVPRFIPRLRA